LLAIPGLSVVCAIAFAQSNPLFEQRRAVAAGVVSRAFVEQSYVARVDEGRATLGTPSSRLIGAGLKSGDPILVDLGTMSVRAHVAFRDELERAARYFAETQEPGSLDFQPSLVIDREDSSRPVVLETSTGDASLYLDALSGSRVTLRSAAGRQSPAPREGAKP
jgi:hypothetical protein